MSKALIKIKLKVSKLRNLIILALVANLITILLFELGKNQTGKSSYSSFSLALCILGLWLITIIAALIHSRNRELFKTELSAWAIFLIMFCTPFPLLGVYQAFNPVSGKGDNLAVAHIKSPPILLIHNILTHAQKKLYKTNNSVHKVRQ